MLRNIQILFFLLFFGVSLFPVSTAFAQEENAKNLPFLARVSATYTVRNDSSTHVKLEIRLRNTTSVQYAKQYALQVNSPDVSQARATDAQGKNLAIDIGRSPAHTNLTVLFPDTDPLVGRDRERLFTLEYVSQDTASKYGEVLEVTVPRLADPDFYEQYSVMIVVPQNFGSPSWVRPEQYTVDTINGAQVVRFTDAAKDGVSILFGQSQTYDLSLRYHVTNPAQNTGIVEVALPPDTSWQRVWYQDISPRPESIRTDADGNWIAQFRLAGQATQDITATAQAVLFAQPQLEVPQVSPLREQTAAWWQRSDGSGWLASQGNWPVHHDLIQQAGKKNTSAQSIYTFVVETLRYNSARGQQPGNIQRLGALGALQDPSNALCQEYTDVFIALARAAGIPARRVTGYAVSQSSSLRPLSLVRDELHAWPEYYDVQRGLWIPVDPTWGDTTGGVDYFHHFDLRHIAFAKQGLSDSLPLAVGEYKLGGEQEPDVQVSIALQTFVPDSAEVSLTVRPLRGVSWFGQAKKVEITVENLSGLSSYNTVVTTEVHGAEVVGETEWSIPSLLPFQKKTRYLELSGDDWMFASDVQLKVSGGGTTVEQHTSARKSIAHPVIRTVALGGVVAFVSLCAGGVSVLGARRLGFVRRKSKKS